MAMQPQYSPSDCGNRKFHENAGSNNRNSMPPLACMQPSRNWLQEAYLQLGSANVLRPENLRLALGHQKLLKGTGKMALENDADCTSRKRLREAQTVVAREYTFAPNVDLQQQRGDATSAFYLRHTVPAVSNGLTSEVSVKWLKKFTGSRAQMASCPSVLQTQLQCEILKQKQEIDQIVEVQWGEMKQAFREKSLRHASCVLAAVEEGALKRLKNHEVELEKAKQRNLELEERVKELSLETQLWQNMSRSNEMIVLNLRTTLEQVVAQSIEQIIKEGCGESGEGEHGESSDFCEGSIEGMEQQCRVCSFREEEYILLLPCRHLCSLCKLCEARLDSCPVCKATKKASFQVYRS